MVEEYHIVERFPLKAEGLEEWEAQEVFDTEDEAYKYLTSFLNYGKISRFEPFQGVEGYTDDELQYLWRVSRIRKLKTYS